MTDLEKRAEEYACNFWFDTSTSVTKSSVKELLIEFAQSETELLSKHLIEMQKTNGALTDRVNELTDTPSTVCQERKDVVDECEKENKELKEQEEQWKQEKWALKTNLDDALDLIDAYKKRVAELEKQILVWHDLRVDKNDLPSKMGIDSKEVYV